MIDIKDIIKQYWYYFTSSNYQANDPKSILKSLESFKRLTESKSQQEKDDPIFLLSTSWRAGSTLMQRIMMTEQKLILWGEPWGRMSIIPRITESLAAVSDDWPYDKNKVSLVKEEFSKTFLVGDLYPHGEFFRDGLKSMLNSWLANSARELGFNRWGLKEVRLDAADACVLRWLYPNSHFIVLIRNPIDVFTSAKHWQLYYRWPDFPVNNATTFAHHWNRLAMSWTKLPENFNYHLIKYEDIINNRYDFRKLENSIGLKLDETVAIDKKVGGTKNKREITPQEKRIILKIAKEGMKEYGYL